MVPRYLRALKREASFHPGYLARTVYVGGGTPSELDAGRMRELFSAIAPRHAPPGDLREFTFEGNPESLDCAKLDELLRAGVGRLSLGLQTPDDRLLEAVGRRHCFSIAVDLMLGLPGQTLGGALKGLRSVVDLGPGHVSVYCLQAEEGTPFSRQGVYPDEDLVREMFEAAIDELGRSGLRHYEISNFARPGRESLHNLNTWLNGPCLGLGCAAAGFVGGLRYQNEAGLEAYCARVERGEDPAVSSESLCGKAAAGEELMLGLRMIDGLPLTAGARRHFSGELEALRGRGLLDVSDGRARLSREGVFLANEVFRAFVAPFDEDATAAGGKSRAPGAPR
jgi:oxygen-independent coproporphyrinogen-3 oxidase